MGFKFEFTFRNIQDILTRTEIPKHQVGTEQNRTEQNITFLFHLTLFSRQFGYNTLRLVRDSSGKIVKISSFAAAYPSE